MWSPVWSPVFAELLHFFLSLFEGEKRVISFSFTGRKIQNPKQLEKQLVDQYND
jgi:hypothetical protein